MAASYYLRDGKGDRVPVSKEQLVQVQNEFARDRTFTLRDAILRKLSRPIPSTPTVGVSQNALAS